MSNPRGIREAHARIIPKGPHDVSPLDKIRTLPRKIVKTAPMSAMTIGEKGMRTNNKGGGLDRLHRPPFYYSNYGY